MENCVHGNGMHLFEYSKEDWKALLHITFLAEIVESVLRKTNGRNETHKNGGEKFYIGSR
jgi:hypothetical protein